MGLVSTRLFCLRLFPSSSNSCMSNCRPRLVSCFRTVSSWLFSALFFLIVGTLQVIRQLILFSYFLFANAVESLIGGLVFPVSQFLLNNFSRVLVNDGAGHCLMLNILVFPLLLLLLHHLLVLLLVLQKLVHSSLLISLFHWIYLGVESAPISLLVLLLILLLLYLSPLVILKILQPCSKFLLIESFLYYIGYSYLWIIILNTICSNFYISSWDIKRVLPCS